MMIRQTATGWELVDEGGAIVASGDLATVVAAIETPTQMHWEGPITLEGEVTGDGRAADPGAWEWEAPFPLRWQREGGTHNDAVTVGIVWEVERRDGGVIYGRGTFDLGSDDGREAARHVAEGLTNDVSIEPDSVNVELRVVQEVVDEWDEMTEAMVEGEYEAPERETDDEGRVILDEFRYDDMLEVTTSGRIRTLALVTTAAFDETRIELADGLSLDDLAEPETEGTDVEDEPDAEAASGVTAIVAASGPERPPVSWFEDPQLDGPTPLTVEGGRVYGHLAAWGTCHIGRSGCTTPPRSPSGYAYFTTGETEVDCADGCDTVPTGVISIGGGHADLSADARSVVAHYDSTSTAVADVAVGEDEHGIWVAGAVRPGATDEQVRALRGSSLSGDWRKIGGSLEMVAALGVNVPGFPIPRGLAASATPVERPRAQARMDGGRDEPVALVAAGIVDAVEIPGTLETFDPVEVTLAPGDRARLARLERALAPQIAAGIRRDVHPPEPEPEAVPSLASRLASVLSRR